MSQIRLLLLTTPLFIQFDGSVVMARIGWSGATTRKWCTTIWFLSVFYENELKGRKTDFNVQNSFVSLSRSLSLFRLVSPCQYSLYELIEPARLTHEFVWKKINDKWPKITLRTFNSATMHRELLIKINDYLDGCFLGGDSHSDCADDNNTDQTKRTNELKSVWIWQKIICKHWMMRWNFRWILIWNEWLPLGQAASCFVCMQTHGRTWWIVSNGYERRLEKKRYSFWLALSRNWHFPFLCILTKSTRFVHIKKI